MVIFLCFLTPHVYFTEFYNKTSLKCDLLTKGLLYLPIRLKNKKISKTMKAFYNYCLRALNTLFICGIWLIVSISFSQQVEFEIQLVDDITSEAIEDAVIKIPKNKQNFISNSDGVVKFLATPPLLLDISHPYYKKKNFRILADKASKKYIIALTANNRQLEEVIVTNRHPQEILKEVVENSKKKLDVPATLRIYSREFFKKNGAYTYYNDGLLNMQIYLQQKKVQTDVLLEQTRSVGIAVPTERFLVGYDLNNILTNYYTFKYLDDLLQLRARKIYQYQLKQHPQSEDLYILHIKPDAEIRGIWYEYLVTYHKKDRIIKEVKCFLPFDRSEIHQKTSDANGRKLFKSYIKLNYLAEGSHYYLINSVEEIGFTTKKEGKEVSMEVKNTLVTNKFSPKLFVYSEKNVFKEKSLINANNKVYTNFWEFDSGLSLTSEEQQVIEFLKNHPERYTNIFQP